MTLLKQRYFIELSYDGELYAGWQIQPHQTTIQGSINASLSILLGENVHLMGCGRTDAGVHAKQFFAHFDTSTPLENKRNLLYTLNRMLPPSITIHRCFEVNYDTHARFDAIERVYQYYFHWEKDPFKARHSFYQPHILQWLPKMQESSFLLSSFQDYAPLSKKNKQNKHSLCHITHIAWALHPNTNQLIFEIGANRFLRNMVRRIVGVLLLIGREKISLAEFKQVMNQNTTLSINYCAPPQGLFLTQVKYPFLH